jgi:N-acetylmuramoyl-L-alanine amidase
MSSFTINDHLISGSKTAFLATPNVGGKFKPGNLDTLVIHYTAGSSAESSIRSMQDPKAKASAHLVVGRDGSVTQLVPFDTIAWHAGRSEHNGRIGMNNYSLGIEIDNAGLLEKHGSTYVSWFKRQYKEEDVVYAVHRNESVARYWHEYTEDQILKVQELCEILVNTYDLKFILGHEEISPGRKVDPGPAFPLDKIRNKLLFNDRDNDGKPDVVELAKEGITMGSLLNFRDQPSTSSEMVAKPLKNGTLVKIISEQGDWYRVKVELEGWVNKKFVKPL